MDNQEARLFEEGRFEELSRLLETKLRKQPEDSEAKFDLAFVWQHSGRADEAIRLYDELLKVNPDDPNVLVNLGLLYHHLRKSRDAIMSFRRVIHLAQTKRLEPAVLSLAHTNLGVVYQSMADFDQAVSAYRKAISVDPTNELARSYLHELREAGDSDRGIMRKRRDPGGREVVEVWHYSEGGEGN